MRSWVAATLQVPIVACKLFPKLSVYCLILLDPTGWLVITRDDIVIFINPFLILTAFFKYIIHSMFSESDSVHKLSCTDYVLR
jgi:hypothetical protein